MEMAIGIALLFVLLCLNAAEIAQTRKRTTRPSDQSQS
jgi:hypothetical protein